MERMHKTHILPALLCLATIFSCTTEDQPVVTVELDIRFTYSPATYARMGVNSREVDRINLFVFDAQGIFLGEWIDETPFLHPNYTITVAGLPAEGEYRFVVWGGLHEGYATRPETFTVGVTTFDEAQLHLEACSDEMNHGIPPLFHGYTTVSVKGGTTPRQQIDLTLVQAYNTICIKTVGLPPTKDEFRLSVRASNGRYGFDYSFADCPEFVYSIPCLKDTKGQLRSYINILKLAADRHPRLEIYNITRQEMLYSVDLPLLLTKVDDVDFEQEHAFKIYIRFVEHNTGLLPIVTLNEESAIESV